MQQMASDIEEAYGRVAVQPLPFIINPGWAGDKVLGGGVKQRVPIGVVAAITPFNAGFFLNLVKASAALITGNSVVLKPSPYTPFQAWIIADTIQGLDFPPGVFNVVTGGLDVARGLTTDPRVDMVSFTGSDTVGAAIMGQGAPSLKRMLLELGGKSALIVRADAPIELAAQNAFWNICCETGQGCCLFTRHIVHNSVKQAFLDKMTELSGYAKVGNPADPTVTVGPLIRARERDRVAGIVDQAVRSGAEIVFGGRTPAGLDRGYFYAPTLLTGVDNSAPVARNEIFGPVGVVIGFDTDAEALAIANDSPYGLGGGIVSADKGRAFEMALELDAGFIVLNEGPGAKHPAAPFGGMKRSGDRARERDRRAGRLYRTEVDRVPGRVIAGAAADREALRFSNPNASSDAVCALGCLDLIIVPQGAAGRCDRPIPRRSSFRPDARTPIRATPRSRRRINYNRARRFLPRRRDPGSVIHRD